MASKGTDRFTMYGNFQTDADFSASKYRVVLVNATGTEDLDVAAADSVLVVGILGADVDDYSSLGAGQYGMPELIVFGPGTGVAGGALNRGVWCIATTGGKLVAATTGQHAICKTMEIAGADDDEIRVWVQQFHLP
jgi:hypothetical protein